MFKFDSVQGGSATRERPARPDAAGDSGPEGRNFTQESLFQDLIQCPQCQASDWQKREAAMVCGRCGYCSNLQGRHISLLPETLSVNNAGEAEAFDTEDEISSRHLFEYVMKKPYNLQAIVRDDALRCAALMAKAAAGLGHNPSILFTFGGGGMEPHLSGLIGPNVVISDISRSLLDLAEKRFDYHHASQPAAFITCDAEKLPFKSGSFDLVIAFEGIHHCMVPQAALNEIWRVSRRRTLIFDNYECLLTQILFKFGKSSRIETSGVKPSRFTKVMLDTMLYNAQLDHSWFELRAVLPYGAVHRLGYKGTQIVHSAMKTVGQTNMFILATDTKEPIDLS